MVRIFKSSPDLFNRVNTLYITVESFSSSNLTPCESPNEPQNGQFGDFFMRF